MLVFHKLPQKIHYFYCVLMPPPTLQDLDGILLLCSCGCGQIPYPNLSVVASLSQVRELQQRFFQKSQIKLWKSQCGGVASRAEARIRPGLCSCDGNNTNPQSCIQVCSFCCILGKREGLVFSFALILCLKR